MQGYIKDYRKELDSAIWLMPPLYHRVWAYLKYKVNHKEAKIPLRDGAFLTISAGQHLTSMREIAKGVSYYENRKLKEPAAKTIKSILDWMIKHQMITIDHGEKGKQYTLITILNWSNYQSEEFLTDRKNHVKGNSQETPESHAGQGLQNENSVTSNSRETVGKQSLPINKNDKECKEELTTTSLSEPAQNSIDLLMDLEDDQNASDFQRLEERFIQLRGTGLSLSAKDFQAMSETLQTVPIAEALSLLDLCFEERKDAQIKVFAYCSSYILAKYKDLLVRQEAERAAGEKKVVPIRSTSRVHTTDSDACKLANLLLNKIKKDQEDFSQPDLQKWAETFEQLLETGKSAKNIQDVILFARSDSWWKAVILSPNQIYKNYDQLRAKASEATSPKRRNERVAHVPDWVNEDEAIKSQRSESEQTAIDNAKREIDELMAERDRRRKELRNG